MNGEKLSEVLVEWWVVCLIGFLSDIVFFFEVGFFIFWSDYFLCGFVVIYLWFLICGI